MTALSLKAGGAPLTPRNRDRPSSRSAGDLVGTITVTLVDDHEISGLNREYFGETGPTDVISFPYFGPLLKEGKEAGQYGRRELGEPAPAVEGPRAEEEPFGDIVISVQTALSQAKEYGVSLERELALLAVHGALHLLGYDDITPDDRDSMRKAEGEVLNCLGYS
ncbi:MAG TPA: rRNA maturation RNase YbeY [Clostridia bacterium]|nr:rRNA maturation RNase YbeY [Clostridia bacterium]